MVHPPSSTIYKVMHEEEYVLNNKGLGFESVHLHFKVSFEPFLHTKLSTKFPDVGTKSGQALMCLWLDHLSLMPSEELAEDTTFRGCTFSLKGECAGNCLMDN